MYTKITYKFKRDGVIGLACGYRPDAEILEEYRVLCAEAGYELYKGEEKVGSAVCLQTGETKRGYTEVKIEEEEQ